MTHGSLFSGIGGFDLAAEWMGWENIFYCECNPFCQKVLKHYWPEAESFNNITKTDFTKYANKIDILTGGFPCQPYSAAGKRRGKEDERHLWPEMLRAIREIKPTFVVGENVRGLTNWNGGVVLEEVCADLESCGYEVQPILLPASSVGAPHQRQRIWLVAANTNSIRLNKCECDNEINTSKGWKYALNDIKPTITPNPNSGRQSGKEHGETESGRITETSVSNYWENFPTQSPICGGDDGLPTQLDGITFPKWRNESIKAYGNAIVPQVALQIFKSITHE